MAQKMTGMDKNPTLQRARSKLRFHTSLKHADIHFAMLPKSEILLHGTPSSYKPRKLMGLKQRPVNIQ